MANERGQVVDCLKRPGGGLLSMQAREEQNTNIHCQVLSVFNVSSWVFGFLGACMCAKLFRSCPTL